MAADGTTKNIVQSLAKGFRVLEVFTATDTEFTLSEIAKRTGLDPGTTFRMINTLISLGYLQRVDNTRRFRLSLKVLDLGFNAIARSGLRTLARPILSALVDEVVEAASLAALDGAEMVYLERVHAGLARMGVDVRIGTRLPAYYTAVGHAALAFLPRETVLRVLALRKPAKITPATPTTVAEIEECLDRVRKRGFAVADPEVILGLRVLAVPVLNIDGYSIAAVSAAAPAMNITLQEFVNKTAKPVMRAACELSKTLQASGTALPGSIAAV